MNRFQTIFLICILSFLLGYKSQSFENIQYLLSLFYIEIIIDLILFYTLALKFDLKISIPLKMKVF